MLLHSQRAWMNECILEAKVGAGKKTFERQDWDAKGKSLHDDTLDYLEDEDCSQDVGRTREVVNEEKETVDNEVSTEDVLSTAQQKLNKEVLPTCRDEEWLESCKRDWDKELYDFMMMLRREQFTVEERTKFIHDTIAAQRRRGLLKNEKGIDSSKNESVNEESKEEEDSEIMEKKTIIARLDKVSSPDGDYLVLYRANGNFRAFNYLMEVLHIFDRQDLFHLYELMMEQYSEITLEGFELILWEDLKIMMEFSTEENYQICNLELEDEIVIHMLVERRYPLSKELLQRMLDLGLEVERESYVALDLIRFIKQQTNEE
ncbi:hypothetical protein Tco_1091132 [Tanacetum coccineum]|uniref:Uncharacterized protein n=1 Tax=Tanacetum coccineum TaxID=301880 RepID=A0ABQ5I7B2_9ASTR